MSIFTTIEESRKLFGSMAIVTDPYLIARLAPPPPMWQVILLNDDVTPGEFVVELLIQIFQKKSEEAVDIMLEVHNKGRASVAICTREIAEARVFQVRGTARNHNHPLQCIMEPV